MILHETESVGLQCCGYERMRSARGMTVYRTGVKPISSPSASTVWGGPGRCTSNCCARRSRTAGCEHSAAVCRDKEAQQGCTYRAIGYKTGGKVLLRSRNNNELRRAVSLDREGAPNNAGRDLPAYSRCIRYSCTAPSNSRSAPGRIISRKCFASGRISAVAGNLRGRTS